MQSRTFPTAHELPWYMPVGRFPGSVRQAPREPSFITGAEKILRIGASLVVEIPPQTQTRPPE